jgi:hypothetical protein
VLCGPFPIGFEVFAFKTGPADLFGEEPILYRMIDVLKKLPIDPRIDRNSGPISVHKQNGDSQRSCRLDDAGRRDAGDTIKMKSGARRHRFFEEVSSIHEQDSPEQISTRAAYRSRTTGASIASILAAILADEGGVLYDVFQQSGDASAGNAALELNVLGLNREDDTSAAAIPPAYIRSDFGLEYYPELADSRGSKWMYPGFNKAISNQPYFAVCN